MPLKVKSSYLSRLGTASEGQRLEIERQNVEIRGKGAIFQFLVVPTVALSNAEDLMTSLCLIAKSRYIQYKFGRMTPAMSA